MAVYRRVDDYNYDYGEYRPITVASIIARLFHRVLALRLEDSILLSPRQKAFRRGTDCVITYVSYERFCVIIHGGESPYSQVTPCGLTACTPGSAPGPTLGNEYGKPLPFLRHMGNLSFACRSSRVRCTWPPVLVTLTTWCCCCSTAPLPTVPRTTSIRRFTSLPRRVMMRWRRHCWTRAPTRTFEPWFVTPTHTNTHSLADSLGSRVSSPVRDNGNGKWKM